MRGFFLAAMTLGLAACGASDGIERDAKAFGAIAADEKITAIGTEPFWSIAITGGEAVYSSPEILDGEAFDVARFAGNNGLGFSGEFRGEKLVLTVTPGECSDGMSDAAYPFTATVALGNETLLGCAYTDQQGAEGSP